MTENAETQNAEKNDPTPAEDNLPPIGDGSTDSSLDVAVLEADIERTREDLARTADQLAAKFDVKARVRTGVAGAKDGATRQLRTLRNRATDAQGKPSTASIGIGAGVITVAVLLVALWRRSHSSRRRGRWHH